MSSTKKKLTINATSSMIQVAFTAILYFFLYKYLLNSLGVKQLGVWSLIISFSSIANLANLGLTSGLVKFVAEYIAEKKEEKIGKLILTSFISLAILFTLVGFIILVGANYFLQFVIDEQFLTIAFSILPFSLASLCINAASGVFTSVLEGYQKNYIRNFIYIVSGIVMYLGTIILTPLFALKGVAIAQLIQSIFILFVAFIFILKVDSYNRIRYWKWSNQSFKELFNYGYKFQAVSIAQLLYEPTTKLLLSKFGGLALLGNYEMASRLVNQFRALLVSANQVVIPVIAESVKTKMKSDIQDFYVKMNRIVLLFALPLSTLLIVITPLISQIWIGEVQYSFIIAMYILIVAAIFNILCGPAYFSCLGEGSLSILVVVHILMAVLNLGIGYLLGKMFGGYGIMLAWGISFAIGSILIPIFYNHKTGIGFRQIYSHNEILISLLSVFIIVLSICLFSMNLNVLSLFQKTSISCIMLLLYIPIVLKNESLKYLMIKIINKK